VTSLRGHGDDMQDILYVRRPGTGLFAMKAVPLAPNTTELRLPFALELSGGHTPDHVHHLSRPNEQVAVWLPRERCRWCKKGYR